MKKDITKNFQRVLDGILERSLLKLIPRSIPPNAFTILRLSFLPVLLYFLWIEQYTYGFALFVFLALSDLIDGALARTRNQITEWGIFFDPVADKLLIGLTGLLLLFRLDFLYLGLLILTIDICLSCDALYKKYVLCEPIKSHITGKIKFTLQAVGIGLLLLYILTGISALLFSGVWVLYGAVFFGLISLFVYYSA